MYLPFFSNMMNLFFSKPNRQVLGELYSILVKMKSGWRGKEAHEIEGINSKLFCKIF
jgi:hypothetical protein